MNTPQKGKLYIVNPLTDTKDEVGLSHSTRLSEMINISTTQTPPLKNNGQLIQSQFGRLLLSSGLENSDRNILYTRST